MKATELMIGDWVISNDLLNRPARYAGIFTEHTPLKGQPYRRLRCMWPGDIDGADVPEERVSPIPLTTEILEKNGFCVKREFNGYATEETCSLDKRSWISFTMAGFYTGWLCEWARIGCRLHIYNIDKENEFRGTAKYVHELQHALRSCGIEKDIEL